MFNIYVITNLTNGKLYFGQTVQELKRYLRSDVTRSILNNGDRKPHLYNALRKYGEQAFTITGLLVVDTKEQADFYERLLIAGFNTKDKHIGYNIAEGGGGSFGYRRVISDEHREKIRLAGIGRKHTEESKQKIAAAHRGKIVTEETKKKQRKSKTEEHKQALRLGWVRRRERLMEASNAA